MLILRFVWLIKRIKNVILISNWNSRQQLFEKSFRLPRLFWCPFNAVLKCFLGKFRREVQVVFGFHPSIAARMLVQPVGTLGIYNSVIWVMSFFPEHHIKKRDLLDLLHSLSWFTPDYVESFSPHLTHFSSECTTHSMTWQQHHNTGQ